MKYKNIKLGALFSCLIFMVHAANVEMLPQTGQTSTVPLAAPAGSDGVLQKGKAWPSPRFILDVSGNCITDKLTGLMWVRNLNTVNSGNALDWNTGLSLANTGTWCGYSDWRMPNVNELRSLVNYGYASPADWLMYGSGSAGSPTCNGACFSNVKTRYWSSSTRTSTPLLAFSVAMGDGYSGADTKSDSSNFRLFPVRGGH